MMQTSSHADRVLRVRDLSVDVSLPQGYAPVVRHLSFDVHRGEILAIVGESGSGKSLTLLSLAQLNPTPATRIVGGSVEFAGHDIMTMTSEELRRVRGAGIGVVFQQPGASLNPVLSIGAQLIEGMQVHEAGLKRGPARSRAVDLLEQVGIPDPAARMRQYPHQLSGGMAQRVAIAIAIANQPALLLADEPTTALDVTIQAQVLQLMRARVMATGTALLLITHNLGLVSQFAHSVAVLYNGRFVEEGTVEEVLSRPTHPYTQGLLRSVPRSVTAGEMLTPIPGAPPAPGTSVSGCAFHPRCSLAQDLCERTRPTLQVAADAEGHLFACHYASEAVCAWTAAESM